MEATAALSLYEIERDKPMPSLNHGIIQIRLGTALQNHYGKQYEIAAEVELKLPKAIKPTIPDLCIFPKMQLKLSHDILKVETPPITTIEILSPKQPIEDVKEKILNNYFPAGVKSAWLVIPTTRTVSIYTPDEKFVSFANGTLTDPATGISLEIDEIFYGLE